MVKSSVIIQNFIAFCFFAAGLASGQNYTVDWHHVVNGGGTSTGEIYSVTGSIGGTVGGVATNGGTSIVTGFWSFYAAGTETPAPVIFIQPSNCSSHIGKAVLFSVVASGDEPLVYQWFKGGTSLINSSHYIGVQANTLVISNITLKDLGQYYCVITNAYGSITSSAASLMILESVAPTLTISAPKSKQVFSDSAAIVLSGTARDNVSVSNVFYKLGSSNWTAASTTNSWGNWFASVDLSVGTNQLAAYCVDASGNCSKTTAVYCIYSPLSAITLSTYGLGKVKGVTNQQRLFIGKNYTLTATAASGYVFSNWTGSVTSGTSKLEFTMLTNMVLQANFISNPFAYLGKSGSYYGLFGDTNQAYSTTNVGPIQITVTSAGSYSGKLTLAGGKYSFTGKFGLDGNATNTVKVSKYSILTVYLNLDLAGGTDLSGTFGNEGWSVPITAYRAGLFDATNAGTYTLIIPGTDTASVQPGGDGYATITVAKSGTAALSGTLADNTTFQNNVPVSREGLYPVYASLYSKKGIVVGWLTFTNETDSDVYGQLLWLKPEQSVAYYASGFTNQFEAVGSRYYATNKPVTGFTNGMIWLNPCNGSTLAVTNGLSISVKNVVSSTNKTLKITLTTKTGIFSGSIGNASISTAAKTIKFKGALNQKKANAFGFFQGTNTTGEVRIEPVR